MFGKQFNYLWLVFVSIKMEIRVIQTNTSYK